MKSISLNNLWCKVGETFALQMAASVLLFIMHLVLANTLGAEQYGVINYAIISAGIISIATSLGFHNSILRYCAEYKELKKWSELRGILVRSFQVVLVTSVLVSLLLIVITRNQQSDSSLANSIYYSALFLPLIALGVWRGRAIRGLNRIKESILPEEVIRPFLICVVSVSVFFVFVDVKISDIAVIYVVSSVVALTVGAWWLYGSMPREIKGSKTEYRTREWLKTSLPMMWAGLLQALMNRADIVLLGVLVGMELTGVYSAAARIALLNVFILKVVDLVVAPKIAATYHSGNHESARSVINQGIIISFIGALPMFLLMMFFPGTLLGFFGDEFRQGEVLLRILAIGQFINALTGPVGHALLMTGFEKTFANTILIFTGLSLFANYMAISNYGVHGAASATAICVGLMNVSLFLAMRKKLFGIVKEN